MTIQEFLDSDLESIELPFKPIYGYASDLEELGFNTIINDSLNLDKFETNGWQVDFWWTIKRNNDRQYMLSGSLFYGDIKLSVYDIEDEE